MGSCSSKKQQHEFSLLKDKVTEFDNLRETIAESIELLDTKFQNHESLALSYFKKHDAIEKSVKLHQAHAKGYYTEHDQLVQSYKADKAAEPVYKMLGPVAPRGPGGTLYNCYGRCYKFKVGESVRIQLTTRAVAGSMGTCSGPPPDGITFDSNTCVYSGVVTTKQEPKIYWYHLGELMPYELISIEIV